MCYVYVEQHWVNNITWEYTRNRCSLIFHWRYYSVLLRAGTKFAIIEPIHFEKRTLIIRITFCSTFSRFWHVCAYAIVSICFSLLPSYYPFNPQYEVARVASSLGTLFLFQLPHNLWLGIFQIDCIFPVSICSKENQHPTHPPNYQANSQNRTESVVLLCGSIKIPHRHFSSFTFSFTLSLSPIYLFFAVLVILSFEIRSIHSHVHVSEMHLAMNGFSFSNKWPMF